MNDLVKDKIQTSLKTENITENKNPISTLYNDEESQSNTLTMADLTPTTKDLKENENIIATESILILSEKFQENTKKITESSPSLPLKPLAEINIELDDVVPLDEGQRLLLNDDDIQVTLNFAANRPSEHVSVIVMAVTNKSKLPVNDFHFEASVKKVMYIFVIIEYNNFEIDHAKIFYY